MAQLAQGEIDRLAKSYGGRSVPAHVTLMGGIVDDEQGIFDRAALLSSQLKVRHLTQTLSPTPTALISRLWISDVKSHVSLRMQQW